MSIERRTGDRRRRVLYNAHRTDVTSGGELARLREARRPSAVYGSRVHRRLRARWFSLVPVRRSTMMLTVGVLVTATALLCAGHYASVGWSSVVNRAEIARPLRLDRPDSFGRWFMVAMLTSTAGAAFLIYQLRRHRNDDFAGRYRLWRVVLTVALLASVQVVASIIDWFGALIDLAFGQRVALSGSDWIRLIVMFGGAILALQVMVEIRRCRVAAASFVVAIVCGLITEAATWNVLEITTLNRWVLVTAAPMMASSAVFIAALSYLRMLYREVRQIEDTVTLAERWQRVRQSLFDQDPDEENDAPVSPPKPKTKSAPREQRKRTQPAKQSRQPLKVRKPQPSDDEESSEERDEATAPAKTSKRSWFGRKKSVEAGDPGQKNLRESDSEESDEHVQHPTEADSPKRKKRRFSLRLKPPTSQDNAVEEEADESTDVAAETPGKRRGWLKRSSKASTEQDADGDESNEDNTKPKRGWLRRKSTATADADTESSADAKPEKRRGWLRRQATEDDSVEGESTSDLKDASVAQPERSTSAPADSEDPIDPNEIDWGAMSKSERRRLRKQLKRQNRAA